MRRILILINFTALITACIVFSADPKWTTFSSDIHKLQFEHPKDWVVDELDDTINIGSSLDALNSGINDGAGASITPASISDFNGATEPMAVLELFREFFEAGREDLTVLSNPELLTINDLPAVSMAYNGKILDLSGIFVMTIMVQDVDVLLRQTIAGSITGEFNESLERFRNSVRFEP